MHIAPLESHPLAHLVQGRLFSTALLIAIVLLATASAWPFSDQEAREAETPKDRKEKRANEQSEGIENNAEGGQHNPRARAAGQMDSKSGKHNAEAADNNAEATGQHNPQARAADKMDSQSEQNSAAAKQQNTHNA